MAKPKRKIRLNYWACCRFILTVSTLVLLVPAQDHEQVNVQFADQDDELYILHISFYGKTFRVSITRQQNVQDFADILCGQAGKDSATGAVECCRLKTECRRYVEMLEKADYLLRHREYVIHPLSDLREKLDNGFILYQVIHRLLAHKRHGGEGMETVRVVQIGAHVGATKNDPLYSIIKGDSRLFAVLLEPLPMHFAELEKNYADVLKDERVVLVNAAVCQFSGPSQFWYRAPPAGAAESLADAPQARPPGTAAARALFDYFYGDWRSQMGGLAAPGRGEEAPAGPPFPGAAATAVRCLTLADALAEAGAAPGEVDVLVVDAEGEDHALLAGAVSGGMLRPWALYFEYVHLPPEGGGALLRVLDAAGYACALDRSGGDFVEYNVVCAAPGLLPPPPRREGGGGAGGVGEGGGLRRPGGGTAGGGETSPSGGGGRFLVGGYWWHQPSNAALEVCFRKVRTMAQSRCEEGVRFLEELFGGEVAGDGSAALPVKSVKNVTFEEVGDDVLVRINEVMVSR